MDFLVYKKDLKDALALIKKTFSKDQILADAHIIGENLILTNSSSHFGIVKNLKITKNFEGNISFRFPLVQWDAWLAEKNRELTFNLIQTNDSLTIFFPEKNEKIELVTDKVDKECLNTIVNISYQPMPNKLEIFNILTKAHVSFIEDNYYLSSYLKLTDLVYQIYNPHFLSAFTRSYNEDLNINRQFGQQGISIHKEAIGFLVKQFPVTEVTDVQYSYNTISKKMIIKIDSAFLLMDYKTKEELDYPDTQFGNVDAKPSFFVLNNDSVQECFAYFKEEKFTQYYMDMTPTHIEVYVNILKENVFKIPLISIDNPDIHTLSFEKNTLAAFFATFEEKEELMLRYIPFKNHAFDNAYFLNFKNDEVIKLLPGIKTSDGFVVTPEIAQKFERELEELEQRLAIPIDESLIEEGEE